MIKLNNKGQSLVLFVLLLPIILLVMVLVIDIGSLFCEKMELDNINEMVVSYGISHYSDVDIYNSLIEIINLNCDDLNEIDVDVSNGSVSVRLVKNGFGVFENILNTNLFEIESYYVGEVSSNKIDRIG